MAKRKTSRRTRRSHNFGTCPCAVGGLGFFDTLPGGALIPALAVGAGLLFLNKKKASAPTTAAEVKTAAQKEAAESPAEMEINASNSATEAVLNPSGEMEMSAHPTLTPPAAMSVASQAGPAMQNALPMMASLISSPTASALPSGVLKTVNTLPAAVAKAVTPPTIKPFSTSASSMASRMSLFSKGGSTAQPTIAKTSTSVIAKMNAAAAKPATSVASKVSPSMFGRSQAAMKAAQAQAQARAKAKSLPMTMRARFK